MIQKNTALIQTVSEVEEKLIESKMKKGKKWSKRKEQQHLGWLDCAWLQTVRRGEELEGVGVKEVGVKKKKKKVE